jgi:hypothetical protein
MTESTVFATENFYESVLWDLGYCYDKYDVQGASTGLTNEPWGIVEYPDPANPDSVIRYYDTVIWFTSRFDEYTVLDTMQCHLRDFVQKGGNLFICGNSLGEDMTNSGAYDDDAADTCDFYAGICGAKIGTPPESAPGIRNPHHYAIGDATPPTGSQITTADTFHYHIGCPISVPHDLIHINDSPPAWSHPEPYLTYLGGIPPAPNDSLVAIYNQVDGGGKVVYMSFDMAAMVDSSSVSKAGMKGRADLMRDVLTNLFGMAASCPHHGGVSDGPVVASGYANRLEQNRPNPFNPDTDILFSIRDAGKVSVRIYNVRGQLVRTLVDENLLPGEYTRHWDGTNDSGRLVASGIYFCKMEAMNFTDTKKMILLK